MGMKGNFRTISAVVFAVLVMAAVAAAGDPLPDGWMAGNPKDYDIGVDKQTVKVGQTAATIKSRTQNPENFGTIVQSFSAESYLGKRVRMSAYVKADKITSWAGLWMRVDGDGKDKMSLSFDNMQTRPITGTLDWKKYEIVLDIPGESKNITFGILLDGPGQAWVDGFEFEVVSKDVPVTGFSGNKSREEPASLGFE